MEQFLGGAAPRETARNLEEAERELAGISKLTRHRLTVSEKNKLKKYAEVGLENKFSMMEPLAGAKASKEQLKTIYSITMRIEEFRKSLQAYDMDDVFMIASEYEIDEETGNFTPVAGSRQVSLFTAASEVSLETVKQASEFMTLYGQNWLLQNLLWGGTKLLNSCDDKLRQKIEEKTMGWMVQHTTGPVYFKVMLDNILASTPESMRGLTNILQETTLKDFDGENVTEYVSFTRGAVEQLKNNNALPIDVLSLVANALKATETEDFASYVSTMYNNHVQRVKVCTVDDLLLNAETEYISLLSSKKWKAKVTEGDASAFFTGKCYECGNKGHKKGDKTCPKYKTDQGSNRGGRGRGRGGRTGGRGQRGGRGNNRNGGRFEKDKKPPKAGESHSRTVNGVNQKWCGIHGYWTWGDLAHTTSDCPNKQKTDTANTAASDNGNSGSGNTDSNNNSGLCGLVSHAVDF